MKSHQFTPPVTLLLSFSLSWGGVGGEKEEGGKNENGGGGGEGGGRGEGTVCH